MNSLSLRNFEERDHETWRKLFSWQAERRAVQIHDLFSTGLDRLAIGPERIPDLSSVNQKLRATTGFEGMPVAGFEGPEAFFPMLADRKFPIGNFIREPHDLTYTPAPDVFHDLYGHLPFLADPAYADFCRRFGLSALPYLDKPEIIRQFDRFFWFTVEFGLIETPQGRRVFGAGLASSISETAHALGPTPLVLPFDVDQIRSQEFKIDEFQNKLFVLKSPEQLYQSLDHFLKRVSA